MAKKKASFEEFLVTSISAQTNEQAQTTKNFVNALVNQKLAGNAPAAPAATAKPRAARKTTTDTPIVQTLFAPAA
jgi:hypothetical protein